jgi:uncharacterized protein (DUF2384 family)
MNNQRIILNLLTSAPDRKEAPVSREPRIRTKKELIRYAQTVFGDPEKADRWLSKPKWFLDGETPLRVINVSSGRQKVQEMLVRIEYGMIG